MSTQETQYLRGSTSDQCTRELRSKAKGLYDNKTIRVGKEYQADVPDFTPKRRRTSIDSKVYETVSWAPNGTYTEKELDIYVNAVTKINKFTIDQALAFLMFNDGNINKAISNLTNFTNTNTRTEPKLEKYADILIRYGKLGEHFVPDEYEFDETYMRMMKEYEPMSIMENIYLRDSQEVKTVDEDPLQLCNGAQLLEMHKAGVKADHNAKHLFGRSLIVLKEQATVDSLIEDNEVEIRLVSGTPIDMESNMKIQKNWTAEDKSLFNQAYAEFNDDYDAIAAIIGTKTPDQVSKYCCSHNFKVRPSKIKLEQ